MKCVRSRSASPHSATRASQHHVRSIGYARSDYFAHLGPKRSVITAKIQEVAPRACLDGDGRGCAVTAWFVHDKLQEVQAKAKELCQADDRDACLVWIHLARKAGPDNAKGFEKACSLGIDTLCKPANKDPREQCLLGYLDDCIDVPPGAPDADVLQQLAHAHRKFGNPGLYGFKPPNGDHRASCDGGNSLGCLLAGLELLGAVPKPPKELPALPAAAELDATIGRACDEGLGIACLAYGFRLLDRGLEEADTKRANSWLEKGCKLGNELSCRHVSVDPQLLEHDYEDYRKRMARACMKTGDGSDCRAYVSLLAVQFQD